MVNVADQSVGLRSSGTKPDAGVEDLAHRPADQLVAVEA